LGDVTRAQAAVAEAFRSEWGKVVAHLIRVTGDWDLAEECAQDAFARALDRWERYGVPANLLGGSRPPPGTVRTTGYAGKASAE
jgi:DNA-directed RNA polymerase specialized sigma24 family protein